MKTADVVIAGAGIIGLSIAVELADTERKVIVVERGRAMDEASWAAAGMLAARDPENPSALRPLSELSLKLYPEYLRRLTELAGRDVPMRTRQTLQATRRGGRFTGVELLTARPLDYSQARGYVEELVCTDRRFLLLDEQSLDPRDLCGALPLAAKAAGATIIEATAVGTIQPGQAGVKVSTSAGLLQAGEFIDCRGAWAGEELRSTLSLKNGSRLPHAVRPRKGQMVTVEIADPTQLRVVVRTPEIYLVPRGDGRVVIGATVEDTGFDKSVEPDAVARLLADATSLWPPLGRALTAATWAGLRPGSIDDLPLIGPNNMEMDNTGTKNTGTNNQDRIEASAISHCWQAAGHFRNGILLAPATARLMRQWLEGEIPPVELAMFSRNAL